MTLELPGVDKLLAQLKQEPLPPPKALDVQKLRRMPVKLPVAVLHGLEREALRRGMRPDILAAWLLTLIISDNLVAAVLDTRRTNGD